jgi:hypothetical protein
MSEELDLDFLDLDSVNDAPPVVPSGDYDARIIDAEVRESKTGSKYVSYTIAIMAGPSAGRRVFGMWSLKPENLWRMKRDFNRLGYKPEGGVPKIADIRGLEGTVTISASPKKDENGNVTDELENRISSWKAGL